MARLSETSPSRIKPRGQLRRTFAKLGPGLITGAADDDPSGISTYSVAGASIGYPILWTALFTFPLMAAVQLMCARVGLVTGRGLGAVIRGRYPAWVLWTACFLLVVANVFNLGADLGGMGDVMQMVTGVSTYFWTPFFTALIVGLLLWSSYRRIRQVFKWLTIVLFAYVITSFLAHPDWRAVVYSTFVPHVEWTRDFLSVLVGLLGTTISPYLFFWEASEEVEEEREMGRITVEAREGATDEELADATIDSNTGMFYSNFVMYFIILTAAATLHAHQIRNVETARQAADALAPLAGRGAYWLFAIALIGVGMLAVPILAGSCAYAIAEAAQWESESLNERPWRAPRFYSIIGLAMIVGLALNFFGLQAVRMLFWAAVLNGVLAPPLIVLVVLLSGDRTVMGERTNGPVATALGWTCAAFMAFAAVAMLVI